MALKLATFTQEETTGNFSVDESGVLTKQALCFVEGDHTDNQGRQHVFDVERLQRIAKNTQSFFSSGANIPVLKDHKKDTDHTIGSVEGEWIVRPVTENDITNSRNSNLIGKMGLFTTNVMLKTKDAIDAVSRNVINTISPGLDFMSDTIREISLTPTPAIVGMSLFTEALTWEELEQSETDYEKLKEQFNSVSDYFFQLVKNILAATNLENKDAYLLNAIDGYNAKLVEMLEINPVQEDDVYGQYPNQPMQNFPQQQMGGQMMGGMAQAQNQMGMYNAKRKSIAAFSMQDFYNKTQNS